MRNSTEVSKQLTSMGVQNELAIMTNFSDYVIRLYFVSEREFISLKDRFNCKLIRVV